MNDARKKHADRRQIDVGEMRNFARDFLGWDELTTAQAAEMVGCSRRSWSRFENREKRIADSQIRLFWYEVALTKLEQAEDKGPDALKEALGGDLTVKNIFDYMFNAWERWDPALKKRD